MPTDLARLEVTIDASGQYAVNGQTLVTTDATALRAALQAATNGRSLPLTLRADGRTPHQAVVTVLEIAGSMGLKQLSIATIPTPVAAPSPPQPALSPDP